MPQEIKIPPLGESIREVQIVTWLKREGDWVDKDESVAQIESEKATVDLPAPVAGVLASVLKGDGQMAAVGETIGTLDPAAKPARAQPKTPAASPTQPRKDGAQTPGATGQVAAPRHTDKVMPAARRSLAEARLQPEEVEATGPGGRLLKEDVLRHVETKQREPQPSQSQREASATSSKSPSTPVVTREEEVVPMSPIRRRIAERLVEAQQTAALLTTFNEIDMTAVVDLRTKFRDAFQKKYDVKLGFMSFFVKAAVESLKEYPGLNAEIRGTDIVYRNYQDVGIAVGGGRGLVVPVLRDAQRMSFAEIELAIADFAARAQANQLKPDELSGGTFTITNGGVYGSLLSTPLVNPPQSGILGLHAIQDRPVARNDQVVIRPMMYVAVTYDHRIVDGREAVSFLRRIKEIVEDPPRMLLEV